MRALEGLWEAEEDERMPPSESSGDVVHYHSELADAASDTQDQIQDSVVAHIESDTIARITEALRLIDDEPDQYGTCLRCGGAIELERHEIVPWTRLCASCAREVEDVSG